MTEHPPAHTPIDPWPHSQVTRGHTVPAPAAGAAGRHRTPRWLVPLMAGTGALAVVVFLAVVFWPASGGSGQSEPLPFQPLAQVGEVEFSDRSNTVFTVAADDVGYAAAVQGDYLELIALELGSGEELWRQRVTGSDRWQTIIATSDGVAAYGGGFTSSPRPLIMYDRDDGSQRWARGDLHGNDTFWIFEDAMVLVDRQTGRLRGIDLADGSTGWSEVFPDDGSVTVVPVVDEAELYGTSHLLGEAPMPRGSDQIVMVGDDRSARVINTDGETLSIGGNVADPDDKLVAYGDWLYVATDEAGYRVEAYSLSDLHAEPRSLYRMRDTERAPMTLAPCGGGNVCVLDRVNGDDDTTEMLAISADDGELWRAEVPEARRVLSVGDWSVVGGESLDFRAFDAQGDSVLSGPGLATRINAGNLLIFSAQPDSFPGHISLAGQPLGQPRVELGPVPEVVGEQCSWTEHHLMCPSREDVKIWRFTGEQ